MFKALPILYVVFLQQGELQLENTKRDLHQKWELVQKGLAVLNTVTKQPMPGDNEKKTSSLMDSVSKLVYWYSFFLSPCPSLFSSLPQAHSLPLPSSLFLPLPSLPFFTPFLSLFPCVPSLPLNSPWYVCYLVTWRARISKWNRNMPLCMVVYVC